jgi:glycosyltransferase involved in cell wall biosynthesis
VTMVRTDAKVTVIIPTLNPGDRLVRCLTSVRSQGPMVGEILVIDGGSTDGSIAQHQDGDVRILGGPGVSLVDAWNLGVEQASCPWLAFLDSDDEWTPGALESHLRVVAGNPIEATSGRVAYVCDEVPPPPQLRPELLTSTPVGWMPGSILVSSDAARRLGPFRADLGLASDIDWVDRLRSQVRCCPHDAVVLRKTVTSASVSMAGSRREDGRSRLSDDLLRLARERTRRPRHQDQ